MFTTQSPADLATGLHVSWFALATALVLLMQAGFLLLEAGRARPNNTASIAEKRLLGLAICAGVFVIAGFPALFGVGDSGLFGFGGLERVATDPAALMKAALHVAMCAVAAAIVSAVVAERMTLRGHAALAVLVAGLIYPLVGHWQWGGVFLPGNPAFLADIGFIDQAGASIVHSLGAWAALSAAMAIGPRLGRFDADGAPRPIPGRSRGLAMGGALVLTVGWIGLNAGAASPASPLLPVIIANTLTAGCFGCLAAIALGAARGERASRPRHAIIGLIAGMVAISAGCAAVGLPAAAAIGAVGGAGALLAADALTRHWKIDDPADAVAAHGVGGALGTLLVAPFARADALLAATRFEQFAVQAFGVVVIFATVFALSQIALWLLAQIMPLRVSPEQEARGLDLPEHTAALEADDHGAACPRLDPPAAQPGHDPLVLTPADGLQSEPSVLADALDQVVRRQVRALDELDAERRRLADFADAASDWLWEIDRDLRVTFLSDRFAAATGRDAASAIGRPLPELFLIDGPGAGGLTRALMGGAPFAKLELRCETPDGGVRAFRLSGAPVRDAAGAVTGHRGAAADITELVDRENELKATVAKLRRARRRAEASTRAKSAFLANMSHEIRTPLNGVLGMAHVLAQEDLPAGQRDLVEAIDDCGRSLMVILNDVLDLSKIEHGKMTVTRAPGDLRQTIESACRLFRASAQDKGLALTVEVCEDLPDRLSCDVARVRQCVTNLVSNAVKFTDTGEVSVSAACAPAPDGDGLVITVAVEDTGVGVGKDMREGVFEAFVQADGSATRRHGGSGLGLAITRKLARMMGGDLTLESVEGQGSTFTLTFHAGRHEPAAAPAPDAAPGEPAAAGGPQPDEAPLALLPIQKVLLVDDNAVNRQVARLFLEPGGAGVIEAENGVEALERLERESFDLVLLDIHMPVLDGPGTVERIRGANAPWSSVPLVALTADAMIGDRERYLAMGMDGYVAKPIDRAALFAEIARLARAPAAEEDDENDEPPAADAA
ncbi:MAG: ATP-binding protein [Caulobacterales bacterium]|nr:ATP-binding protein [Caulobacterales bacterium]